MSETDATMGVPPDTWARDATKDSIALAAFILLQDIKTPPDARLFINEIVRNL